MIPAPVQSAIKKLSALEIMGDQLRKDAIEARCELERFYALEPFGDNISATQAKVLEMQLNRRARITQGTKQA